ncbi:MAG TPA: adenylyl-sulfate kinase [Bacillus sp. (in: firmicutes)]|uniref:adenylyl-sulfate kinase n=1 Tax=Bacillus litorisediminis TaxID=2922713 RepID=UPI001FAD9C89|nr:adenylyl-sulfate kinase [Bacillus litorisediminis]HWO75362.1 adenylyl-sulfate kinase [Bacillus sp. (in: firmicutes)]
MPKRNSNQHIVWHKSVVKKEDRQALHGHKSLMIWFTGLSGSGKSTIANALQLELFKKGISVYLLDGDNLRHGINNDLTFTENDRKENIRRTAEIGKLFVEAGIVVLAALISPYKEDREIARSKFNQGEFIEVFVDCPIEECQKRDPKGLYKKAMNGEIKGFTGIDHPYEVPKNPEIILKTNESSIEECTNSMIRYLYENINLLQTREE